MMTGLCVVVALLLLGDPSQGNVASFTEVQERPETKARVEKVEGGHAIIRDVTGDYRQHVQLFAELIRLAEARKEPSAEYFGIYPVDPDSVDSPELLHWQIGVRLSARGPATASLPPAPYRIEHLPSVEAVVLDTTVGKATIDGLSLLRWLPEHGYVQTGPTRMEYKAQGGNLMMLPARIVVPVRKRVSGLSLPPVNRN